MSHLKRQVVPKTWAIPRKGTKYVVSPRSNLENGIPLLIAVRDLLKFTENEREVQKLLNEKSILVNGRVAKDIKLGLNLFDVIEFPTIKKHYRLTLSENGKFSPHEINKEEAGEKIGKVINKQMLKGKKMQINLSDGENFISEIKCNTGDSLLIKLSDRKIEKCLPMKEGSKVMMIAGKHIGKHGEISKINKEKKNIEIRLGEQNIEAPNKQIIVIK